MMGESLHPEHVLGGGHIGYVGDIGQVGGVREMEIGEIDVINYRTVTGFFKQDEESTNPDGFDYSMANFGLINRPYETDAEFDPKKEKSQWQRFEHHLSTLNEQSPPNVQYKLFYMGRHGEGYHNQAETYYGTEAWDCYWSLKDGDGTSTWADSHLASTGQEQALKASQFWAFQRAFMNIPLPQSYYVSPLTRCLETANITFGNIVLGGGAKAFQPIIKELFREGISAHTCDRRSSKSAIMAQYPDWEFEEGFKEKDPFWKEGMSETPEEEYRRTKVAFDDVFGSDNSTYVSVTSHSGQIAMSLQVLGHRKFPLGTGQVIPILIQAETVRGSPPQPLKGPAYVPIEACKEAPPLPAGR